MMAAAKIPAVSGELREKEPMSRHTSWRVGGPAELYFRPADLEDLSLFLKGLSPATPVFWLGLGSNLRSVGILCRHPGHDRRRPCDECRGARP